MCYFMIQFHNFWMYLRILILLILILSPPIELLKSGSIHPLLCSFLPIHQLSHITIHLFSLKLNILAQVLFIINPILYHRLISIILIFLHIITQYSYFFHVIILAIPLVLSFEQKIYVLAFNLQQ